jgi:hypothetical protein
MRLVRQSSATLVAAALQNSAAGAGGHTLQETVFLSAMTLLWLVRTFWHSKISLVTYSLLGFSIPC